MIYLNGGPQLAIEQSTVDGGMMIGPWLEQQALPAHAVYWVLPQPPAAAHSRPQRARGDRAAHLGFTVKLNSSFCDWPEYFREGHTTIIHGTFVKTVLALDFSLQAWRRGWHGEYEWPPVDLMDPGRPEGFAFDPSIGGTADTLPLEHAVVVRNSDGITDYYDARVLLGSTPMSSGAKEWISSTRPYWPGDDAISPRAREAIYHSICMLHMTDQSVFGTGPHFVDVEQYYRQRAAWETPEESCASQQQGPTETGTLATEAFYEQAMLLISQAPPYQHFPSFEPPKIRK